QLLAEPPDEPYHLDWLGAITEGLLEGESKAELPKAPGDPLYDLQVCIADPQDPVAERAFRVEDAGEEACKPRARRRRRPGDQKINLLETISISGADGRHCQVRTAS